MIANKHRFSFWDSENILKFIVVIDSFVITLKVIELYSLNG